MSAVIETRDTTSLEALRAKELAALIGDSLSNADEGHCVRINYLDRDEAARICANIRAESPPDVHASVLTPSE